MTIRPRSQRQRPVVNFLPAARQPCPECLQFPCLTPNPCQNSQREDSGWTANLGMSAQPAVSMDLRNAESLAAPQPSSSQNDSTSLPSTLLDLFPRMQVVAGGIPTGETLWVGLNEEDPADMTAELAEEKPAWFTHQALPLLFPPVRVTRRMEIEPPVVINLNQQGDVLTRDVPIQLLRS